MLRATVILLLTLLSAPVWAEDWCAASHAEAKYGAGMAVIGGAQKEKFFELLQQASQLSDLCTKVQQLYGVSFTAFESGDAKDKVGGMSRTTSQGTYGEVDTDAMFSGEQLYVGFVGSREDYDTLGNEICELRSESDKDLTINVSSPLDWVGLKTARQFSHLGLDAVFLCKGNTLNYVQ